MTTTRKPPGKPWPKGVSGNAKGRPAGVGKLQRLRDALEKDIPAILQSMVQAAIGGDAVAARLVLDKCLPSLKPTEQPQAITLPDGTLTDQGKAVLRAVGAGELAVSQGAQLMAAVGSLAKLVEVTELEARVAALENNHGNKS